MVGFFVWKDWIGSVEFSLRRMMFDGGDDDGEDFFGDAR